VLILQDLQERKPQAEPVAHKEGAGGSMAKILVSDSLAQDGIEILQDGGLNEVTYKPDITPEQLVAEIGEYDALVIRSRSQGDGRGAAGR
jgi:phosphoglycerate dehydrogenase-like enzyme